MFRFRSSLIAAGMFTLGTVLSPGAGVVSAQQIDQPAEQAARLAAALAPFAGGWSKHGFGLTVHPDGTAESVWRTYQWCKDPGVKPPCDSLEDGSIIGGGHAVLLFSSVEGQTAYGSLVDISDPAQPIFRSASLTLRPDGTALLRSGDESRVRTPPSSATDGTVLCGTIEAWQAGWCGA